jgi:hypothetical protein
MGIIYQTGAGLSIDLERRQDVSGFLREDIRNCHVKRVEQQVCFGARFREVSHGARD